MKKKLCAIGIILSAIGVFSIHLAAEDKKVTPQKAEPPVLKELNLKIAKGLKAEQWSNESKILTAKVWSEYKAAFIKNKHTKAYAGLASLRPDVMNYDKYIGRYSRKKEETRVWMEVFKDAGGHFILKLEGHEIPAVVYNCGILFTTGDIVYSQLPRLGPKPHATLEMFMLCKIKGQYYFRGIRSRQMGLRLYRIKAKASP